MKSKIKIQRNEVTIMKKTFTTIIATLMAILMLATIPMSTLAAVGDTYDEKEYGATATYTVDDSYVIYVPAEIYVGQDNSIMIEDNNVTPNKEICVYITNLSDEGTINLTNVYDAEEQITAKFYDLNNEPASNNSPSGRGWIGSFVGFDTENTSFTFNVEALSVPEHAKAGKYTGLVEFKTEIVQTGEDFGA